MKQAVLILISFIIMAPCLLAQNPLSLKECVDYAMDHNHTLQKSRLDCEKSEQARKEIIGALLPQVNASGSMAYNIKINEVVMPNFMNSMLPVAMQDPNASKYMTVQMGMDYSANLGANLIQQVLNFSLFNAVDISKSAKKMTEIGVEISTDEVIEHTATIYYNIQVLGYGLEQFDNSIALMDKTLKVMEVNKANGIVRQVDLDRIKVSKTNLLTQKRNMSDAREIQKNLLKLEMGLPMSENIEIQNIDIATMEEMIERRQVSDFDVNGLLPFQLIKKKEELTFLQKRSAQYEALPTLSLGANYTYNFVSDEFFRGDTFHKIPVSMVSLNLRIPIFSGMSRQSKFNQAKIEMTKAVQDEQQLEQSLTMAHSNATMQLENSLETIELQRSNKQLAEDVYNVTDSNFKDGISSLSDVLNASSSLIQSQISYVQALNSYVQSYIQMKKSEGTIREILK